MIEGKPASRRYLRINDLLIRYGISKSTLYRRIDEDDLPPPIYLTRSTPVWLEAYLDEFDDGRLQPSSCER